MLGGGVNTKNSGRFANISAMTSPRRTPSPAIQPA
jgi:hypothetical protein